MPGSTRATGKAEVTMELDGNRLRIAVHDDGRGLAWLLLIPQRQPSSRQNSASSVFASG